MSPPIQTNIYIHPHTHTKHRHPNTNTNTTQIMNYTFSAHITPCLINNDTSTPFLVFLPIVPLYGALPPRPLLSPLSSSTITNPPRIPISDKSPLAIKSPVDAEQVGTTWVQAHRRLGLEHLLPPLCRNDTKIKDQSESSTVTETGAETFLTMASQVGAL